MTAFAKLAGVGENQISRVRLAVSEAVTNVVLHAYRDHPSHVEGGGLVHVGAAVAGSGKGDWDELWVVVADDGCGMRPRHDSPGGGHGLRLIADACDELTVLRRGDGGTELRMRFDLDDAPGGRASPPESETVRGVVGD